MNTKEALKQLAKILGSFSVHSQFMKELSGLLKKELKGKEVTFFTILTTQLNNLSSFGSMIHTVDGHEKLKGSDGHYYSIHLQNKQFNVRLIVYISDANEISLLCAFYERAGKSTTDYTRYTRIMEQRRYELKGDNTNE